MNIYEALILAIVEGVTEFLPVSSTGHLIVTSALMGIEDNPFVKNYNVIIQAGAIFSVLVLYWRRFLPEVSFYKKLICAFLPAALIGLAVKDYIDVLLGSVYVVAVALALGGVALIWLDKKLADLPHTKTIKEMSLKNALLIGFFQCLAFVPGVSRSAATIIGGLSQKMSRKEAAEFSFFLGVPTLAGASLIKSLDAFNSGFSTDEVKLLVLGALVSFVVAMIAIKTFIQLISKVGFFYFGVYRILLGGLILVLLLLGQDLQVT